MPEGIAAVFGLVCGIAFSLTFSVGSWERGYNTGICQALGAERVIQDDVSKTWFCRTGTVAFAVPSYANKRGGSDER